ncbi:MAG: hypothetical protein IKU02_05110 [Bacteroidaceae bacterium]|nr:hypothetical protein [Bacteroidaceae bacterium]
MNIRRFPLVLFVLCTALCMGAANRRTTISKVSSHVDVTAAVDYCITGPEPFGDEGMVNIVNTDKAVVILQRIKPSVAIADWLSHVQINGEAAANGTNCQVKIYDHGCIVMPYGNSFKPLTVYSEQSFGGESCDNFGLENSSGYMNTLTEAKLNNRIRSFKLKRGYMVTFSTRAAGRGYSRCFIAADADLLVRTLPAVLDKKITSYRIFKWYDTGKPQLAAAGGNNEACSALNATSTYTWGTTGDMSPDVENVPHHIYENYPSPASLGACTTSPHMKTNNEPMNTADDPKGKTEDVDAVLANWEDLMATGMRLCSPSSWDGSDYTNGTGYIKRFIDSIDARGWRCDIIDLHCYWPESNFGTIKNWTTSTGRPVWISEWVWGASWNSNGAFASGVTESQNKDAISRICNTMNNNDCIERYYYWNGERDPSKLYKNGNLTEAGEYYASITSGLGYNGKYDFVPTTPPQYGPSKYSCKVLSTGKTRIQWYDPNGEFNQLMEIQMKNADGQWVVLDTIAQKEAPSNYAYTIDSDDESILYRLHFIDLFGKEYYTNDDIELGDAFEVGGEFLYAGGNMLPNGEFDLGFTGWTSGTGAPLAEPNFEVVPDGGYKSENYLQSHLTGAIGTASSVKTVVDLEPGQNYVFRLASRNSGSNVKFSLSDDGSAQRKVAGKATDQSDWHSDYFVFNADIYPKGILAFYTLAAKAQIDGVQLRKLFQNRAEAIADGLEKARLRAEAQKTFYAQYPALNNDLTARLEAITGTDETALQQAEQALKEHQEAIRKLKEVEVMDAALQAVALKPCPDYDEMLSLAANAKEAQTAQEVLSSASQLKTLMDENLAFTRSSKQPRLGSFSNEKSDGWTVKAGTYKNGDQKATTKFGKTCWNAWWSTTNNSATMAICQTVTGLTEGYYMLECKAMTEHFCITDQHCYLQSGGVEAVSPKISKGLYDMPVENHWDTLTTAPIYVEPNGSLTLGFVGSKQGATGYWHTFGNATATTDNREGWWCATDFVLKFHAIDDQTAISQLKAETGLADGLYTLDGRRLQLSAHLPRGIYIKVENGKARKQVFVK